MTFVRVIGAILLEGNKLPEKGELICHVLNNMEAFGFSATEVF